VINSAVFAEGMGGVAVEDEMEKRKHTECHLRLSAFLCVPVSDVWSRLSSDLAGVDKVPREAN